MTDDARSRWDARWSEAVPASPAPFVVSTQRFFPPSGSALDVASGPGRHGLWLAGLGYRTTLVDISPVALDLAVTEAGRRNLEIQVVERDVEAAGLPPGAWDVVVVHYFLHRPLLRAVPQALAPGGVVVFCQPTERTLTLDEHAPARYLLRDGELEVVVGSWGLEVLLLEEGPSRSGRYEARVVARRPGGDAA